MALGDAYVSTAELKAHANVQDADDDAALARVTVAVSRSIERYCGRQFNDAGTVSARVYHPATSGDYVAVDDFSTTTGLVVKSDTASDGTYATTLSASNYSAWPFNGVVDGQTGHPYREIRVHTGQGLRQNNRPSVQVTAQWGWTAVPADVKEAALIQAARVFGRKYSHNGVIGFGDFVVRVSNRLDPNVEQMLAPYRVQALVV